MLHRKIFCKMFLTCFKQIPLQKVDAFAKNARFFDVLPKLLIYYLKYNMNVYFIPYIY